MNISRYVDTAEPVETLSVAEALAQLREGERRRDKATARVDALLEDPGYQRWNMTIGLTLVALRPAQDSRKR